MTSSWPRLNAPGSTTGMARTRTSGRTTASSARGSSPTRASIFRESPLALATQGRLDEKGKLEISGLPRLVLTSERSAGLAYKVVATGSVPEGLPVVRPVPEWLLELQGDNARLPDGRAGAGSDKAEFFVGSPLINSAETDAKRNRPIIEPAELRVEGSFRGQPLTYSTEIQLHPVPDTVAIGPPSPRPRGASVAVRASQEIIDRFGEGTGCIAIVLDCSGSMVDPIPESSTMPRGPSGRCSPRSTRARRSVSGPSARFPRGSRWCPDRKGGLAPDGNDPIAQAARQEPERTIRRQIPPTTWGESNSTSGAGTSTPSNSYFGTPLLQAMWGAADQDLRHAKGIRTLLVLTDGEDTRFATNFGSIEGTMAVSFGVFVDGDLHSYDFFSSPLLGSERCSEPRGHFTRWDFSRT